MNLIYHVDLSHRQIQTRRMREYAFWIAVGLMAVVILYGIAEFIVPGWLFG